MTTQIYSNDTRKVLRLNRMLHPLSDVDRLYFLRRERGRGPLGVEDGVQIEVQSLAKYVSAFEELLLRTVSKEHILTLNLKHAIKISRN